MPAPCVTQVAANKVSLLCWITAFQKETAFGFVGELLLVVGCGLPVCGGKHSTNVLFSCMGLAGAAARCYLFSVAYYVSSTYQ